MSGPVVLFDKSFLQSLTIDESVWFDHFFLTNVCPIFFVETLSDLSKKMKITRAPEDEVRIIADKFPEMHGSPNLHHDLLSESNLLGNNIPMTGQIAIGEDRRVELPGKTGVIIHSTKEAEAFTRWRRREFFEVERLFAKKWREHLSNPSIDAAKANLNSIGIDPKYCKCFEDAKRISDKFVSLKDNSGDRFTIACQLLKIPVEIFSQILLNWSFKNFPSLINFAPYSAHVLEVEIFYLIALASERISADRPSNKTDIAYLNYLPFCNIFVSTDHLHQNCTHLFLRSDQEFVYGIDLKNDLTKINDYYNKFPDDKKQKGLNYFAPYPPMEGDFLVSKLWDHHLPRWREARSRIPHKGKLDSEIVEILDAPESVPDKSDKRIADISFISVEHMVQKKKGSWYQVPKDSNPD